MKLYGVCMALVAICALGSASARTKLPAWNPPQQQIAQPQAAPLATPGQQPQQEYQLQPVPETVQPAARASAPTERGAYRLGTGDKLKVTIYNNDKLSGEYPIGGDGKVALPMLGRVAVGGMTLDEVSNVLTNLLADGYFVNPRVTVDIAAYRPVYILGEVQKPGEYAFAENMTVYRLVAQAGGFTYRANKKKMRVRHDSQPSNESKIAEDSVVQPGDTIIVSQRYF